MENNPSDIPSEDSEEGEDVAKQEGREDLESKLLKEINETSGRNYKNLEEAKKGIKETYSYIGQIGDLKQKAQKWDESQKKQTQAQIRKSIDEEYYKKIDRIELGSKHSGAESYFDILYAIGKEKGISALEAYENTPEGQKIKNLVEREEKERQATQPSFVESGQRLPSGQMGISREEFAKLPLKEQAKIVQKLPGWGEKLPKRNISSGKISG